LTGGLGAGGAPGDRVELGLGHGGARVPKESSKLGPVAVHASVREGDVRVALEDEQN
jgi:hypothetical protein